MASAFNLTAQINLRGPDNLKPIVAQIRRELNGITADVNVRLDAKSAKSIDLVSNRLNAMNNILVQTKNNTISLNKSLQDLSNSLSSVQASGNSSASGVGKVSKNIETVSKNIKVARTEMEEFGKQAALAVRRFAAFSVVTSTVFALTNAITDGFKAFISFDRELVKLQQVTGKGKLGIKDLENEITRLATSLGVSSESLISVASTLAQAGLSANETKIALEALAKTELAPSFDSLTETTEGAIAALRQFGLQAQDLEAVLGSINAVAAAFAVESKDIITAIQRTGGVFASASKGVSEGKDALNEFIAVFTSVRATTRESAETIATGLRTIFTRIQRADTIKQLRQFGVELQDLEGKFVGPYEAIKRLSEALLQLDPRDVRFSTIVEELGGFRQIGKVIPLIQQFATAQQALGVAQKGAGSLTDAQVKAQQSLANQIAKVREQFLALIRDIGQSTVFQGLFKIVLGLTSGFLSLASAFKPILPILAVFTAIKGVSAIGQFATGFFGGIKKGGGAGATGQNIGESLSGAKEKQRAETTAKAADAIRLNTDALKNLTIAITKLTSNLNKGDATTLSGGGKVLAFNKGGLVPGNGGGDTVPAYLEGGEIVMNRKAVQKYGASNLLRMNKYADGGTVNITAKELKNRYRSSKSIQNLITDQADENSYITGKAINTLDNITFNRRVYKLNKPDLIDDWKGFETAVKDKTGGTLTNISKNDPSFPIDIVGSNYGPLEVRNRTQSTSNRSLLDKLIRYYIAKQEFAKLKNNPSPDDIKLGNLGIVYNSAKYNPPNAKELNIGGKIQKFGEGTKGLGGVQPISTNPISQDILNKLAEVGGSRRARELLSLDKIKARISTVKTTGKMPSASDVFDKRFLQSADATPFLSTLSSLADEAVELYSGTTAADFELTQEQIAAARDVAIAGFQSDMKDLGSYYRLRKGVPLHVHTGIIAPDKYPIIDRLLEKQHMAQVEAAQEFAPNEKITPLKKEDRQKFGEANLGGYNLEAILALLGSGNGKKTTQDAIDFANGLTPLAASVFGVPPNIPTQAKLTVSSSNVTKALDGIIKAFAFGGQAEGPNFEEVKKQIMDKYPQIDFRISKRKKAFGYMAQAGLMGGKRTKVDFASNLKNLITVTDQMASSLIEPQTLVSGGFVKSAGGLAEKRKQLPSVNDIGSQMSEQLDLIKGKNAWNQSKNNCAQIAVALGKKFGYKVDEDLIRSQLDLFQKIRLGQNSPIGIRPTEELLKKHATLRRLTKNPTAQSSEAHVLIREGNELMKHVSLEVFGKEYNYGVAGKDWPIILRIPLKKESAETKNNGGLISKFAGGGVLAKVSNGEAFVPPNVAKKIGYAKLNKMNQADRNGMKGYAGGGGISIFKGPGSGTSDSIGPINVPVGSYIIREKATKALGLHKNGGTIVRKFAEGGLSKAERKKKKEAYLAEQRGGLSREEARSAGIIREDFGGSQVDVLADVKKSARERITKAAETGAVLPVNMGEEKTVAGPGGTLVKQKGRTVTADEAKALTEKKAAGSTEVSTTSRKKDITATADPKQLDAIYKKIEQQVANNYKKLYAEEKKKIDDLYDQREADLNEQVFAGTLSVADRFDQGLKLDEERQKSKDEAKAKLTAEAKTAQSKAVEEFKVGKQTTQVTERKAEQQKAADTETQSAMAQVAKEVKAKYEKLFAEERASLKEFYDKRIKQVQDEGGDVAAVTAEYQAAVADAKKSLEVAGKAERDKAVAAVPAQLQEQKMAKVETERENKAREADAFYDVKKGMGTGGPTGPEEFNFTTSNAAQQRIADQDMFKYKAEQAGTSEAAVKKDLAQQIGKRTYENQRFYGAKVTEAQSSLATRRDTAMKIGSSISEAKAQLAAAPKGSDEAAAAATRLADAQSRLAAESEAILQQMIELRPDLAATDEGMKQLSEGAKNIATELSSGNIVNAKEAMAKTVGKELTPGQAQQIAIAQTAKANNIDQGLLTRQFTSGAGGKMMRQQQFIQSREGQAFGGLAELAPGLTSRFAKTGIGKGIIKGGEFVSGKGGALSNIFANRLGGFTGIGGGLAVGAESLKQLLPKSMTSDPNTAGALGALGGAGSGAAMGAQLGSFAGPIGTLIGGVGGAIIGGIQGWFSSKNQAVLTNALENVAKTTGDLDEAFKKLEADSSQVNFDKAQKAFGDVVNAGKDIESLAFSKTGFENLGSTFSGGVDKFSAGLKEGDISKTIMGGLQTAFGASGGGFLVDYFSAPSEEQRKEATAAMVGGGVQKQEAATRLASQQMKTKSADEIAAILDNIKNGTGELNPIVDQYVQGALKAAQAADETKQLTAEQEKNITAQAKERAELDAYMKKRKESGATDEQIAKELSTNKAAAIKEGQEAIKVQAEVTAKQDLLAKTMKEVTIVSENLADVYRRITAYAQKYSDELDNFSQDVDSMLAGLGGDTNMRAVNRQNEQVLGNVSAYSMEEVKAASSAAAGMMGGTPEAQKLANNAVGQKIVMDQIPNLLRNASTPEAREQAINQIEQLLKDQGIDGEGIKVVLKDLENKLTQEGGATASEVQEQVQKSFETIGKGAETLQGVVKKYNDTLQQARKYQQDYNKAILEAGSYLRKATQVRLNGELELAKALGRSPTLEELNKPFDVEIDSLTSKLVGTGNLAAGEASDPMAIANAITSAEKRKAEIEKTNPDLFAAGAGIPAGAAGDPMREQLNQAQLANIQAVGELTVASNEGRQALEKLANDGSKAANALAKIQEEQQAMEGFGNFAQKVFTAEPQELARMEINAAALNASQNAGPEFFKSRQNRQMAFAGLEQKREFMLPEEYRKEKAQLIRKNFEAQGKRGEDVVTTIGGKDITLDELTKRLEGGVDETDPNVIEFRKATEIQAKANEALGMLNVEQALIVERAMLRLEAFLTNDFPNIIKKGNTESAEANKPPKMPEPKEKKPSETEKELEKAKTERDARAAEEKKAKEDAAKAGGFGWGPGAARGIEATRAKNKAREATVAKKAADANVADLEAKVKAEQEAAAKEQKTQEEQKAAADEAAKTKQKEADKAKSEETLERTRRTRTGEDRPRPTMVAGSTGRIPQSQVEERYGSLRSQAQVQQATAAPVQAEELVDKFAQGFYTQLAKNSETELERLGGVKSEKEKELAQKEKRLKLARSAAMAAGPGRVETSPHVRKAQEEFDMAKADMETINEKIQQETTNLSDYKERAKGKLSPVQIQAQQQLKSIEAQSLQSNRSKAIDKTLSGGSPKLPTTETDFMTPEEKRAIVMTSAPINPQTQAVAKGLTVPAGGLPSIDNGLIESLGTLINLASSDPGLMVHDAILLEAINSLQEPLAAIETAAINSIKETADQQTVSKLSQPTLTNPIGAYSKKQYDKENNLILATAYTQTKSRAEGRVVSAPVPVTKPPQTNTTRTKEPKTTTSPTADANLLTLNPDSLEKLTQFNTNFGTYVDKLVNFSFPKIPDKIEMNGNHVVDVRISGAAAFEGLKKDFTNMMQTEIKKAMGKIWGQSGGSMGERPTGAGESK